MRAVAQLEAMLFGVFSTTGDRLISSRPLLKMPPPVRVALLWVTVVPRSMSWLPLPMPPPDWVALLPETVLPWTVRRPRLKAPPPKEGFVPTAPTAPLLLRVEFLMRARMLGEPRNSPPPSAPSVSPRAVLPTTVLRVIDTSCRFQTPPPSSDEVLLL